MTESTSSRTEGRLVGGKYQIESRIGSGAMGAVYRARQLSLNRTVALKVLKREAVATWGGVKRFVQEAKLLTRLSHPNVVIVYDVELETEEPYIAMEFVEGPSLADVLDHPGRFTKPDPVLVSKDLACGLAYVHSRGVLHRGIKPANILLKEGVQAMLADFGLARGADSAALTTEGFVVGTPAYLAPEQLSTPIYNEQTDLYQLGLVLYEAITGKPFFSPGADIRQVIAGRLEGRIPDLVKVVPEVPSPLSRAVMRCLAKDPVLRFQSATELMDALAQIPTAGSEQIPVGRTALTPARLSPRRASAMTPSASGMRKTEPEQAGRTRSSLPFVIAASLLIAGGAVLTRSTASLSSSPASRTQQPASDVKIDVVEWAYDLPRRMLRVKPRLSQSVATGWRLSAGPAHPLTGEATAWTAADFPYQPDQPFTLSILRSDGGPELTLTEADLLRALRAEGERLTRTLRDFWSRSKLTDQTFVDQLTSGLGHRSIQTAKQSEAAKRMEAELDGKLKILNPVKSFLSIAPLYFDTSAIPLVERLALYKQMAPLELADAVAKSYGLPPPFGQELATVTGRSLRQQEQPDSRRFENYVYVSRTPQALIGSQLACRVPLPRGSTEVLLGAEYRLDSASVLRLFLDSVPLYVSFKPDRRRPERFDLPYVRCLQDGISVARPQTFMHPHGFYVGHYVPAAIVAPETKLSVDVVRIHPSSPFDNDCVWSVWLGFPK